MPLAQLHPHVFVCVYFFCCCTLSNHCPQMLTGDDVASVVIDVGSTNVKIGFAGEDSPKSIYPTVCKRRLTLPLCVSGSRQRELFVVHSAPLARCFCRRAPFVLLLVAVTIVLTHYRLSVCWKATTTKTLQPPTVTARRALAQVRRQQPTQVCFSSVDAQLQIGFGGSVLFAAFSACVHKTNNSSPIRHPLTPNE